MDGTSREQGLFSPRYGPSGEVKLKISFVGDTETGAKTSFIDRYINDSFSEAHESSIGVSFNVEFVFVNGKKVKVVMWDIPRQDMYDSISSSYFRNVDGIVIGYDITNKGSFEAVKQRYIGLKERYPNAAVMVIGNKVDLEDKRQVSQEEGKMFASDLGSSLFFESKQNYNKLSYYCF